MKHLPVLKNEIVDQFNYLAGLSGAVFVDGTFGMGGHSLAIIKDIAPKNSSIELIGIDRDAETLSEARENLEKTSLADRYIFVHDNFSNIKAILSGLHIDKIDGALLDLGVSSMQLDRTKRGFSFMESDALLDMRMDSSQSLDAQYVLNHYPKNVLKEIFIKYGEEKFAGRIAHNICRSRSEIKIEKVSELLGILEQSIPEGVRKKSHKHFATNVFRALRIEVNNELAPLEKSIRDFIDLMNPSSRLAVITFHSLEDRIVKNIFKELSKGCTCADNMPLCVCGKKPSINLITKKPVVPTSVEINSNKRSRSAKLRVAEKI